MLARSIACETAVLCVSPAVWAQEGTFHAWLVAPAMVTPGQTFEVVLWASFEGNLLRPVGWFAGVQCSFEISGPAASFDRADPISRGLAFILDQGTPDGQ